MSGISHIICIRESFLFINMVLGTCSLFLYFFFSDPIWVWKLTLFVGDDIFHMKMIQQNFLMRVMLTRDFLN
jgi:hypothetical protein